MRFASAKVGVVAAAAADVGTLIYEGFPVLSTLTIRPET